MSSVEVVVLFTVASFAFGFFAAAARDLRAARLRRIAGRRCRARTCSNRKVNGLSVWCRDHTDAILAGRQLTNEAMRHECAQRVGARRWLLLAEVQLEQERANVDVVTECAAQTEEERRINRRLWESSLNGTATVLYPTLAVRVDELVALAGEYPDGETPPGPEWEGAARFV